MSKLPEKSYWERLKEAWLLPQTSGLKEAIRNHFAGHTSVDRESYYHDLENSLKGLVESIIFSGRAGDLDLCAFEYRSLYGRIMGEHPLPESIVFLFGKSKKVVEPKDYQAIKGSMESAYGQELTYLSFIPQELDWFQVVYLRQQDIEVQPIQTICIYLSSKLWPSDREVLSRWKKGLISEKERSAIIAGLLEPASQAIAIARLKKDMQLPEERRKALAEMVARTPFMTLTRMAQKDAVSRSILYLPAYLHGDRIGGGVLMGSGFERDQEAIDVLHFSTQMLLAHLRLAEFPEETRSAETEVLQRLLIRRFRHNLQHPIGTLMDAVRRFHESYKQMMITLERGIDAWKPDLMPNYIVKFLNYVAAEYRLEGAEASDEGGDEAQEERQDKGVVRFPIDIKGTERIERFDRSILAEVLRNLFTNTGRYAARKGLQKVVLDADREGPVIDYREAGGTGLPPDIAADPWRLHSRDPEVDTSTGQGLFLAKKLMQVHGGDIEYDKDYREGCRFKIYLRKENRDGDEQSASGNRR